MKVLVVGGGGREHALVWKIAQSPKVDRIYCAPGNAGIAACAELVPLSAESIPDLMAFAQREAVDLTVVGPEAPLIAGIADEFAANGLRVFGPSRQAARLEGSKVFCKNLFRRHRIPTADYQVFDCPKEAAKYVRARGVPIVIKADGLAKGKGVVVAHDLDTALEAVDDMLVKKTFGSAGDRVVVEECLVGHELSLKVFTDGESIVPMEPARDYKRAHDRDEGPNTGGMGAYSPVPLVSRDVANTAIRTVVRPIVDALRSEGIRYRGVLYAGLMLTNSGLKALEVNCRFGDPETQVIIPRLGSDLVDVLLATCEDRLAEVVVDWSSRAAVCVVLASRGYPASAETGIPVHGLEAAGAMDDVAVFHAGTSRGTDGAIVTDGGRVLGVTAWGDSLGAARKRAYEAASHVQFDGMQYRKDIAAGVTQ
ncbi:MAG TPA: phosphoribosylamine--glycine ligase [Armatimonadota bacterium]|nr:phosphoribosylamine--glycine ligase [Armatimonadota bacterium]